MNDIRRLRKEFLRLLTEDSETKDRRRKEFNQAIFNKKEGWAVFNGTDLDMVMEKFSKAQQIIEEEMGSEIKISVTGGGMRNLEKQKLVTKLIINNDPIDFKDDINSFTENIGVAPLSVNIVYNPDDGFIAFISYWAFI